METHYYIGQMYLNELSDYESAIRVYKYLHGLKEYSHIPNFMEGLVQAYSRSGQVSEAVEVLENWILSNPDDTEAKSMLKYLKEEES